MAPTRENAAKRSRGNSGSSDIEGSSASRRGGRGRGGGGRGRGKNSGFVRNLSTSLGGVGDHDNGAFDFGRFMLENDESTSTDNKNQQQQQQQQERLASTASTSASTASATSASGTAAAVAAEVATAVKLEKKQQQQQQHQEEEPAALAPAAATTVAPPADPTVQELNAQLKTENDGLKTENDGLKKENGDLKTANDTLKKENRDLKTADDALKRENNDLKTRCGQLETDKGQLEKDYAALEQVNKNLEAELKNEKEERAIAEQARDKLVDKQKRAVIIMNNMHEALLAERKATSDAAQAQIKRVANLPDPRSFDQPRTASSTSDNDDNGTKRKRRIVKTPNNKKSKKTDYLPGYVAPTKQSDNCKTLEQTTSVERAMWTLLRHVEFGRNEKFYVCRYDCEDGVLYKERDESTHNKTVHAAVYDEDNNPKADMQALAVIVPNYGLFPVQDGAAAFAVNDPGKAEASDVDMDDGGNIDYQADSEDDDNELYNNNNINGLEEGTFILGGAGHLDQ
jgi:FtsZ-binding cell division protein ZapB